MKIIGLRFWSLPFDNFYILPDKLRVSPEIQSAINLLSVYTPEKLGDIMELDYKTKKAFEDGYYKCEEDMKEKYTLELWMGFYKNGIYNIPLNKLNKVREENIRKLFKDDPDLENFIQFLFQKGKLS